MRNILREIDQKKKLKLGNFFIEYNSLDSAEQTISEVFHELSYKFTSDNSTPFIIDAGSNIGIATLYFKSLYSNARIICFEPDPNAFQKLKANIHNNKISNISLINAAIAT